jgi:chemotaxis protein histidine kinase CheA
VKRGLAVNLFNSIKTAFLYHWNLLGFFGGLGLAALLPFPTVGIPLVLAAETAYLAFLGTHPGFQQYVAAQKAKQQREQSKASAEGGLERILNALPPKSVQRFETLRSRCLELRQIAVGLKDPSRADAPMPLEELQTEGLDRLLWTFLRLLFTQYMLERFFRRTDEEQINKTIKNLEQSLQAQSVGPDDPQKQKIKKALEDNIQTSRERLANLEKARSNSELVRLEIDRLENKIQSLSEMAINRQEPDYIVHQVDEVASSMVQTERTMNELQFATGLTTEEEVPQLLQRQAIATKK